MKNQTNCPKKNPEWSFSPGKDHQRIPYSPFEVSQMRNSDPCMKCYHRKNCNYTEEPKRTPHRKVRYMQKPKYPLLPLKVKGELINGRKQTGLVPVRELKADGSTKITILKPFYPKLSDSHIRMHSPPTPQTPITPKPQDSKHRKFTR